MIDFRPISLTVGLMLTTLGTAMALPAMADLYAGNPDWKVFLGAAILTVFVGGALFLSSRGGRAELGAREAFVLTSAAWMLMPAFGALPLVFAELDLSYTDAYFEAMSGLTTTGSTVITGLDHAPPGILLWRAVLQWLGGIGIIVMAIAILPLMQVGGMQLFRSEGMDISDAKAMPRVTHIAAGITLIYIALTALCALALWAAGMTLFEGVAHSLTTLSTAGFSTSDGSIGHFDSAAIDYIVTLFMVMAGTPFLLYLRAVRGSWRALTDDSQVRSYLGILGMATLLMVAWQTLASDMALADALRHSAFNVVSVITGTGYASTDYGLWGGFPATVFFFLTFIGGCSASTACGIKIFRWQILFSTARAHLKRLWQPHGVFLPHYNDRPIPDSVTKSVMSFFFLFALFFAILSLALTGLGLDLVTAVSGAATAMANVGPGLGDVIGPAGNFAPLPDSAKWLLSAGMLLGRLELFTVLVLFTPRFWRG